MSTVGEIPRKQNVIIHDPRVQDFLVMHGIDNQLESHCGGVIDTSRQTNIGVKYCKGELVFNVYIIGQKEGFNVKAESLMIPDKSKREIIRHIQRVHAESGNVDDPLEIAIKTIWLRLKQLVSSRQK